MSPITVRADVGPAIVCESKTEAAPAPMKKFPTETMSPPEVKTFGNSARSGATKVDAAFQALNEQAPVTRGVNHKPPHADETAAPRRDTRRNNSRNSNGRSSDESVRGHGRKSFESGRRSADGSANRKSNESQRSSTTDTLQNDDATDQLSQITDILLARLITTLSDSTLGNPALLLQTLLGFSPDDYNDLLAALSESRLSYVDIISAYLHNIKVMSEDSGSTSAALSGTLTRSLIEQYNSLLSQAVKSPQSIARANLVSDNDGRSNLADMLQRANSNESKPERRSFEGMVPKGPSGLGFGRRHSGDGKQRQQQSLFPSDNKPATQPMMDASLLELSKLLTSAPKVTVPDLTGNCSMAMPQQGGITQEQLAAFIQNAGMMPNNATQFVPQPAPQPTVVPSLPFLQQAGNNLNGMMAMNLTNPYALMQPQPWTVPMQQPQMAGAGTRGVVGWQGATTVGFQQPGNLLRGWGGAGLETVPESFSTQLQVDPSCFALNMQPHSQQ